MEFRAGPCGPLLLPGRRGAVVYVGSDDGILHALDVITGNETWQFSTGRDVDLPGRFARSGLRRQC